MPKWCSNWPHCQCGLDMANGLGESGMKLLVFRDGMGDLKRVPVSEIQTLAIVEGFTEGDYPRSCPQHRQEPQDDAS